MTREEAIQLLREIDAFYLNGLHLMSGMRGNGKSSMTHAAIVQYMKYRQALGMARQALENSVKGSRSLPDVCKGCTDVFETMRHSCRYGHDSYDEDHNLEWTCHHMNNKPDGCSWGTCDKSVCPILKGE